MAFSAVFTLGDAWLLFWHQQQNSHSNQWWKKCEKTHFVVSSSNTDWCYKHRQQPDSRLHQTLMEGGEWPLFRNTQSHNSNPRCKVSIILLPRNTHTHTNWKLFFFCATHLAIWLWGVVQVNLPIDPPLTLSLNRAGQSGTEETTDVTISDVCHSNALILPHLCGNAVAWILLHFHFYFAEKSSVPMISMKWQGKHLCAVQVIFVKSASLPALVGHVSESVFPQIGMLRLLSCNRDQETTAKILISRSLATRVSRAAMLAMLPRKARNRWRKSWPSQKNRSITVRCFHFSFTKHTFYNLHQSSSCFQSTLITNPATKNALCVVSMLLFILWGFCFSQGHIKSSGTWGQSTLSHQYLTMQDQTQTELKSQQPTFFCRWLCGCYVPCKRLHSLFCTSSDAPKWDSADCFVETQPKTVFLTAFLNDDSFQ